MERATFEIVIGVFSGVVSSAVVFIIAWVTKQVLIPKYQDIVYQGVKIGGKWRSELPVEARGAGKINVENFLDLKQSGHNISGTNTKVDTFEGNRTRSEVFDVTGEIKDRFFIGTVKSHKGDRLAATAFVFEVKGDGRVMEGGQAFYDISKNAINTVIRNWHKEESTDIETMASERK
jgi:hypothetical protein